MPRSVLLLALSTAALTLALAACSAPRPDEQEQALAQSEQAAEQVAQPMPAQAQPDATACDASQAQWLAGKAPAEADVQQAQKDAGALRTRTLKPGQMVTMEFDAARLNVELDEKGLVAAVRCG